MTYGTAHDTTIALLKRYTQLFGVPFEELILEPDLDDPNNDDSDWVTISTIYGGALDEEFVMERKHAEFVLHVIAGQCIAEASYTGLTDDSEKETWSVGMYDGAGGEFDSPDPIKIRRSR